MDTQSDELLNSKRFLGHAAYMLEMLDTGIQMLGPDIDLLTEIMTDLGHKHVRYGVRAEMFPAMGEALEYMLGQVLGEQQFSPACREAWKEVYAAMTRDMILAMKKHR